jgi:hypothetical protein
MDAQTRPPVLAKPRGRGFARAPTAIVLLLIQETGTEEPDERNPDFYVSTWSATPRKLVGSKTLIHTRRPEAWAGLSEAEAALLDFLRRGGQTSELSPEETVRRTVALLREPRRFERLLEIAGSEPPRVRAMIGAIGEEIGKKPGALERLRASLNPLSRFDFGMLKALSCASRWQAKGARQA